MYPYKLKFENVKFVNFEYGYIYDRQDTNATGNPINGFAEFISCDFKFNRCGAKSGADNSSFINCYFEFNDWCGLWGYLGSVIYINGGKSQYNGASGWDSWTPPTTGTLTGPFQILVSTGVESITFNSMYVEPKSSTRKNNYLYIPIGVYKEGSLSVVAAMSFINTRLNGLGCTALIDIDDDVVVEGLSFVSTYIRNLKVDSSTKNICNMSSSAQISRLSFSGGRISDIKNLSDANVTDWSLFNSAANINITSDYSKYSAVTSPTEGNVFSVVGSVSSTGGIYFGSGFTVTKEGTGVYLISLGVTNAGGSNTTYFYATATSQYRTAEVDQVNSRVLPVSSSSFRVYNLLSGVPIDYNFTFSCTVAA